MTQQVQQVCLEFGFVLPNFNRRREEWDRRGREHTNRRVQETTHILFLNPPNVTHFALL